MRHWIASTTEKNIMEKNSKTFKCDSCAYNPCHYTSLDSLFNCIRKNGCDYKKRSGETLLNSLKPEKRNIFGTYTEQLMYADRNSYDAFGFTEDDLYEEVQNNAD